jgi:hypothetical protein
MVEMVASGGQKSLDRRGYLPGTVSHHFSLALVGA